ncbi:MAG: non-ribosomal peptide synthetase, partial [Candidatus Electrothrix sp. EH2]|nr:non-ribosomal peptide synthetase [Candidatus Electrothrix sp. EH2]
EPGEIEAVLKQHHAVKEAVVNLYEVNNNKRLIAYLTTTDKAEKERIVTELKERLKAQLPDYMMLNSFTFLDKFPLTPNSKIDRKSLPDPQLNLTRVYEAPRTDHESQLAEIWGQLLKQDNISIHDNYFELGGNSLLATQLISQIRKTFEIQLSVRKLFELPTIAELIMPIEAMMRVNQSSAVLSHERERVEL